MAGRKCRREFGCAEPGCKEKSYYSYSALKDMRRSIAREPNVIWHCEKHRYVESYPTAERPEIRVRWTRTADRYGKPQWECDTKAGGDYPQRATEMVDGAGFSKDVFFARASDYPLGAVLDVTYRLTMPDDRAAAMASARLIRRQMLEHERETREADERHYPDWNRRERQDHLQAVMRAASPATLVELDRMIDEGTP